MFKNERETKREREARRQREVWTSRGLGVAAGLSLLWFLRRGWVRYPTAQDVPQALIRSGKSIPGVVVRVGDGDGARLYHLPWLRRLVYQVFSPKKLASLRKGTRKPLSDISISVRLAGVDAPECAHFGKPGQEYGPAARDWLKRRIMGKHVRVHLHSRDQYQRVVASMFTREWWWPLPLSTRNVSVDLARAGYAVVYRGAGAEYGGPVAKTAIERAEAAAKRTRKGMWKSKRAENPQDFKARMKRQGVSHPVGTLGFVIPLLPRRVQHWLYRLSGRE